ncbi:integration host factor [Actinomycetospora endophytica]|uniref:Integration host factor n=1 Tax=Actinomycetospora endophytica TaxID=2291215 RepID=A0ABS8P5W0_9PSEU|nr:integration host factor, actinobacterial type [Actinomycetospora endophytica]MCD2193645.1 integration host factor [Actinomycetospora endophytica]
MAPPTLTPEQREAALAKAREARRARMALLARISSGEETIRSVLQRAHSDPVVGKVKVSQLVRAIPGYGPAKTEALLEGVGITGGRRAGGLGSRQREALLTALS